MPHAPASGAIRVLLVDHHRDTRDMYALALEFSGMTVRSVGTARDVAHVLAHDRPDIVVTDLNLGGESGLDLAQRISSDGATGSIPVILLTGEARAELSSRAKAAGCAAVAVKPMMPDALAELITATLVARRPVVPPWRVHVEEQRGPAVHPAQSRRGFPPTEETAT